MTAIPGPMANRRGARAPRAYLAGAGALGAAGRADADGRGAVRATLEEETGTDDPVLLGFPPTKKARQSRAGVRDVGLFIGRIRRPAQLPTFT